LKNGLVDEVLPKDCPIEFTVTCTVNTIDYDASVAAGTTVVYQ